MTYPYERAFTMGRQSELLLNDELHKIYESVKHVTEDIKEGEITPPPAKMNGALWLDKKTNKLYRYHKMKKTWEVLFKDEFKIFGDMFSTYPPENPILGQFWLHQDQLFYFNGHAWRPVRAVEEKGSPLDLGSFQSFQFVSPLLSVGNAVIRDNERNHIEEVLDEKGATDKLDALHHSEFLGTKKWSYGDAIEETKPMQTVSPYVQYLVPDIRLDRVFIDGILSHSYEKTSAITLEYKKEDVKGKNVSLIHINPTHLKEVKKRLYKVDKLTGKVCFTEKDVELYGYRHDSPFGTLLTPEHVPNDGGYIRLNDGIMLSTRQCQSYDFVLLVAYTFKWVTGTGKLTHIKGHTEGTTYLLDDISGPQNIFVGGYYLEDTDYTLDTLGKTITLKENAKSLPLSSITSRKREYGFIHEVDIHGNGIVKTLYDYIEPLVFINGEVVTEEDGVNFFNNTLKIKGARLNMMWAVMELKGDAKDPSFSMLVQKGTTEKGGLISYDVSALLASDTPILFVRGMLISPKDVTRSEDGTLTTPFLVEGEPYILLRDRYHRLLDDTKLTSAFPVGRMHESLVYVNGKLLINSEVTLEFKAPSTVVGKDNEIRLFTNEKESTSAFYIYHEQVSEDGENASYWERLEDTDTLVEGIERVAFSYTNNLTSVRLLKSHLEKNGVFIHASDSIHIYGFKYATLDGNPLIIKSLPIHGENAYTKDLVTFTIPDTYKVGENLLSVYINGIRQHEVIEHTNGQGFTLRGKVPVPSLLSYVIEDTDTASKITRLILTKDHAVPGAGGIYKTYRQDIPVTDADKVSLYPASVTIFVNGVRQSEDGFLILDNHTILFKDRKNRLVGSKDTYPKEYVTDGSMPYIKGGEAAHFTHETSDEILVELREDKRRREKTIRVPPSSHSYHIPLTSYDLPIPLLESEDEILIYVDGLFMGLKDNDGSKYTYTRDRNKGALTINAPHVIERLSLDPLSMLMEEDTHVKERVEELLKGTPYTPTEKTITLEWRTM